MPDQKPPHLVRGERETVQTLLQFQRQSLVRKVALVSDTDARRSPVPSGTTLLWLMVHMSRAEKVWVMGRFLGRMDLVPDDTVGPNDTLAGAVARYRETWSEVDAVVAATPDLGRSAAIVEPGSPGTNLRWILMHLLEETSRHAGHADILRELIDGEVGR